MAYALRALAAKACPARAVRSAPVLRRSFVVCTSRTRLQPRLALLVRHASTATQPIENEESLESDQGLDPTSFETLQGVLHPNTLKAIKHTHMSPVQARIFPLLPDLALPYDPSTLRTKDKPRDLLVKAKTGTGKTMGFLIPAIEARLKAIDAHVESSLTDSGITVTPQFKAKAINRYATERVGTLIVSPTRELATQIAVEATNLTAKHVGFQVRVLLGGESRARQIRDWQGRKDIVVCTPGRVLDLLESEPEFSAAMKHTQVLILDEADTLLHMGFRDDIESIKSYLPNSPERQTFLFSATVSPAIRQVALSTLSSGHKYINCVSEDDSPVHDHIPQYHTILSDPSQFFPHLLRLITHDQLSLGNKSKIIVFFSTTRSVQLFSSFLVKAGPKILPSGNKTKVYEMHSKRDMDRRMAVSKNFRNDTSGAAILVTSDVSARGVDYPGVSRVIQMGVPASGDMYIHRVGRTGRGDNKTGRGDLVLCSWEMGFMRRQLRSMPLKPLTMSALEEQTKELAMSKDAENAGPGKEPIYSLRLAEIDPTCRITAKAVDPDAPHETFMAQVGFYLGRIGELGLNKDEVVSGLQAWTQEVFGLDQPPVVPHGAQMRLGLLGGGGSNNNRSFNRGTGSYGSARASWVGRGSQASRTGTGGSSYGQRSGGYGSSSSSYGSRDSNSYTPRSSSQYGSRDSNYTPRTSSSYGSRDSNSYTPRASSSYGSRDSNSYTPRASSSYGSRDSNSSTPRASSSQYGSRDSNSYTPRSGGSTSSYGSRDSKPYTPRSGSTSSYGSRPFTPRSGNTSSTYSSRDDKPSYGGSGSRQGGSRGGSRDKSSSSYDEFF
ncbi:DEAD-domain-containing protein [Phlegmacium glaucopus]|nr:DEAD-domain-containing protein [Phlegmacium glaucopus]